MLEFFVVRFEEGNEPPYLERLVKPNMFEAMRVYNNEDGYVKIYQLQGGIVVPLCERYDDGIWKEL